jgi:aspartate/methionine/tyrosine aminotransferase
MELLEKAQALEAQGEDIVHMEIGEPDFPTPLSVRDAAIRSITGGKTFYTHSLGLPALKERIARHYYESRGVSISPDRIIITNGTSGAFFLLASVLLDRQRGLVVSDPGYPCYRNFATLLGASVTQLPVGEETHFEVTSGQIAQAQGTKPLVMVCSPSNPTGMVYSRSSLERLWEAVDGKHGVLTVDEIYSGLIYEEAPVTALSVSDEIVVVDGFSKTYAMTGWRLGWIVVPERLVRPIQKVAQNVFISAPTVAQYAGIAAFDAVEEVEAMRRTYKERRDFLYLRLRELGFSLSERPPQGAFYVYANISRWGMDSMKFVERVLTEAKVAVTPGYDFGTNRAGEHVRFSYATEVGRLEVGCRRLESWFKNC